MQVSFLIILMIAVSCAWGKKIKNKCSSPFDIEAGLEWKKSGLLELSDGLLAEGLYDFLCRITVYGVPVCSAGEIESPLITNKKCNRRKRAQLKKMFDFWKLLNDLATLIKPLSPSKYPAPAVATEEPPPSEEAAARRSFNFGKSSTALKNRDEMSRNIPSFPYSRNENESYRRRNVDPYLRKIVARAIQPPLIDGNHVPRVEKMFDEDSSNRRSGDSSSKKETLNPTTDVTMKGDIPVQLKKNDTYESSEPNMEPSHENRGTRRNYANNYTPHNGRNYENSDSDDVEDGMLSREAQDHRKMDLRFSEEDFLPLDANEESSQDSESNIPVQRKNDIKKSSEYSLDKSSQNRGTLKNHSNSYIPRSGYGRNFENIDSDEVDRMLSREAKDQRKHDLRYSEDFLRPDAN